MRAELLPYSDYRCTSIPWLPRVPAHWRVGSVKRVYHVSLGKMHQGEQSDDNDELVAYMKSKHVQWFQVRPSRLPRMWASRQDLDSVGVRNGDLLVCEGGEAGRGGIVRDLEGRCIIEKSLHRVRPRSDADVGYLQYVLFVISQVGWFDALNNKSTIAHFTREKFERLPIPLPPLPEQRLIARYCAHLDARVNRLVRTKRRLIALLTEQKQAIIQQAVTRGLDPDAPVKPSGVA